MLQWPEMRPSCCSQPVLLGSSTRIFFTSAAALVACVYAAMLIFYGLHGVDDAWTLSFDFHYLKDGYVRDQVFGRGSGILAFFGKTHAFLYGAWAKIWGWERFPMRALSSALVLSAALLWGLICWHYTRDKSAALSMVLLCLLFDTFVSNATKARPEALSYFLISLSVLLACKRYWLLSAICAFIAFENHPAGVLAFAILPAFWWTNCRRDSILSAVPSIVAGGVIGLSYYLLLHYEHLPELPSHISGYTGQKKVENFLLNYFVFSKYYRHIPELIIYLASYGVFYTIGRKRIDPNTWWCINLATIGILIISAFIKNAPELYIIHVYPVFVLQLIVVAQQVIGVSLKWLIATIFLLLLPQYTYLAVKEYPFYFPTYNRMIEDHTSGNEIVYLGHSVHWFAFNHRSDVRFYEAGNGDAPIDGTSFVWIRDNKWEHLNAPPSPKLQELTSRCPMHLLSSFTYVDHTVNIERYDCTD